MVSTVYTVICGFGSAWVRIPASEPQNRKRPQKSVKNRINHLLPPSQRSRNRKKPYKPYKRYKPWKFFAVYTVYAVFNGFLRFGLCLAPASEPQNRKKP